MKTLNLFFLLLLLPFTALAGAGYIITESGAPSEWDNSSALTIHPESGDCGSFTNAQMLTKLENNLNYWSDLTEVNISFTLQSGSVGGIDGCNYGDYLVGVSGSDNNKAVNDGFNPVIFDNDGEIIAAVAGTANKYRVLGFANPAGFTSDYSEIVDGQAVFNCLCLSGNSFGPCQVGNSTVTFSEDDLDFTMVHELGHFLNLDHTQINADLIDDGNSANDDNIPTMYPVSENAAEQISPIQDDISALATIYPSSTFTSSHCKVTGSLLDADGKQLRCADVQAIPSDRSKSVAFVSGAYAPAKDNNGNGDTADSGECTSNCGDFQLFLDPGVEYTLKVMPINSSFTGGSGISPCANGQLDTINEETIGTVTAAQCTAGTTIALGNITTTSTGGVTPSASISQALVHDDQEDLNILPPALIGGYYSQPPEATSCPESGGSNNATTNNNSSSSGCQLNAATPFLLENVIVLLGGLFLLFLFRFRSNADTPIHS